jgi:hypothetical protein
MFYTSIRYQWLDETVAKQTNYDDLLQRTRLMGMMDDNIDSKVQKAELRGQFAQLLGGPGRFEMIDTNKDGGIDAAELEKGLALMRTMQAPRASLAPSTVRR